jgi:hypothetical protein
MAAHAEDSMGCACIAQILNLPLAVPTAEAASAERLVTRQNRKVLDLVAAGAAAVCAVVANEGAIAKQEEVCV